MKRSYLFAIGAAVPIAFFAFVVTSNVLRKAEEAAPRATLGGITTPDEYAAFLDHQDPELRRRAAFALAEQGDGRAIEPLLALLAERRQALTAEGGVEPDAAAVQEAADAVRLLAKLGDRRAVGGVEALLACKDDTVLTAAARALGAFRSPMSVDPLEALLSRVLADYDPDKASTARTNLVTEIAAALGRLGEGEKAFERHLALARAYEAEGAYKEALANYARAELLAVEDPSRQAASVKEEEMRGLLAKGAELGAVAELVGHLELGTVERRLDAAKKLGQFRDPKALDALVRALDREQAPEVKAAVLAGLAGYTQEPRALDALCQSLHSKDFAVRDAAARALGAMGNPQAAGPLVAALQDPDPLRKDEEYVYSVAESIVKALGELGEPSAIHPLTRYYDRAEDDNVRREIVIALGKLGATAQLVRIAQVSPSAALQREAVKGLGRSQDTRVTPSLLRLLGKDPQLDPEIALALGALEDSASVPPLLETLRSENAELRLAAVMALGKIGDPRARAPLQYVAEHDADRRVQSVARKAVDVFEEREGAPVAAPVAALGGGEEGEDAPDSEGPLVYEEAPHADAPAAQDGAAAP